MRIKHEYKELIKQKVIKYFGAESKTYLFGSRADDSKFGGDIDIYIETDYKDEIFTQKIKLLVELKKNIGDRKIDIVINNGKYQMPVFEFAQNEGILL